jgi:hypothetical protein
MRLHYLLVAPLLLAAPAQAGQSIATTRISGTIPASCTLDVISSSASQQAVTLKVRRSCNAPHVITVRGGAGGADIVYNNASIKMTQGRYSLFQADYFDGIDTVVIRPSGPGNAQEYARSIRVEVAIA